MLGTCLQNVREKGPLVHNITNYVTVNDVANVILACGASPIMSDEPQDVQDITAICGGLNINIGTLNAEECLEEIEQMEKEGAKFMNVNKMDVHKKKRKGAIIGAVVMTVLMALTIGFMLWGNSQDPIPLGLLVFLIAIPAALIIGLWIALAGRMKEIEGGEEDEASKY